MAAAKTARGVQLQVLLGDGGSPETFAALCSINAARGIVFTADTNDTIVPDCDDPDLMAWVEREKRSLSASINGAGVLNTPDVDTWYDYLTSADSKNVQVIIDVPAADGGRIFQGAFHCTQFEVTGDRGQKQEASVTLQSDGEVTIANNT